MKQQKIKLSKSTQYRFMQAKRQNDLADYQKIIEQFNCLISSQRISILKSVYLHGVCGKNTKNQIIVVDKVGNIKINEIMKILDEEQFVGYFTQRLIQLSEQLLNEKDQIIWIVDLKGKILQLGSKKIYQILKKIIENVQKYFPNILSKLIFVNTPMLFDTIWSQISPYINKQTQSKVLFLNEEEQLHQFVNKNLLPSFLGGEILDKDIIKTNHIWFQEQMIKVEEKQQEMNELSSLKAALSGLSFGKPNNNIESVQQTPLNTQADEN